MRLQCWTYFCFNYHSIYLWSGVVLEQGLLLDSSIHFEGPILFGERLFPPVNKQTRRPLKRPARAMGHKRPMYRLKDRNRIFSTNVEIVQRPDLPSFFHFFFRRSHLGIRLNLCLLLSMFCLLFFFCFYSFMTRNTIPDRAAAPIHHYVYTCRPPYFVFPSIFRVPST